MPIYQVKGNRAHLQPRIPTTPPTPMYSDDDHSSDSGEYNDYRDRDYRHARYNYGQAWQTSRQANRGTRGRGREADEESDRESTEPTVSGFEPTYEQVDRSSKAILANDQDQLLAFKTIQAIHPAALEPYGFLPKTKNPRTAHYDWLRRTPKGVIAMVWCRINNTASDVVFEVTLHTDEVLEVHVPLDSWHRKTCDPEAVRASIQQAYLNLLRGHDNAVIVKPGMKSLRFITQHEYEDICSSSSSSSSKLISRHQRSQSQRLSYQIPFSHDRRPAIHLSSPPPTRQARPAAALPHPHPPQPHPQASHQPRSQPQPPYHHRSRSQQVLPSHQVISPHHAQHQVFSSPLPSPSPYTAPPIPHHQVNYKNTAARTPLSAQPAVFPSRPSRTSGYY